MTKRDYRKGFGRLAALLWATGALALLWWAGEVRRSPLANVCVAEMEPAYEECFTEEARRLAESQSFSEQLIGRFRRGWEGVDLEREVPRWQTERYRTAVVTLAWRELAWALLVWGPFALLAWAFAGFRRPEP